MQLRTVKLFGLLLLAMVAAIVPRPASSQPRLKIVIMRYSAPGGANNYDYVYDTIADRLRLLRSQVASRSQNAAYIRNMDVVPAPQRAAGSDAATHQQWDRDKALVLMWGRVDTFTEGSGPELVATSSLYIGDLSPPPLDRIEVAKINLTRSNYPQIKDTHSLIAAYAMLLDAIRNKKPRDVVAAILASTYNVYNLVSQSGYRPPELPLIKSSLDAIAAKLKAGS